MNTPLRRQGRISDWKDVEGYGFITAEGGGEEVFAHISGFIGSQRRPRLKDRVSFEQSRDPKGRVRASNIEIAGGGSLSAGFAGAILLSLMFFVFLIISILDRQLPLVILLIYLLLSVVSVYLYRGDKRAAKTSRPRVPESSLHWLAILGGWPGAFVAQQALRHKTAKWSFQWRFWACVTANLLALGMLMWSPQAAPIRQVLAAVLG